jgi:hypothetical protein
MMQHIIKPVHWIIFAAFVLLSCTQALPGKNKEEIKASSIIKMLNKEQAVNFTNTIITGDLDFSLVKMKAKLHTSLSQSIIKSAISFTNCRFTGKVICTGNSGGVTYQSVFMQNLLFNTCEFMGIADFQSATVLGSVSFAGCKFNGLAQFNSFCAHAKASYFGQIKAEKEFSFQDALFTGSCDFFKSEFKGNVSFQGSRFDGVFNFSSVQCYARADFSKVRFNNNSIFNYTVFTDVVRFNQLRSIGMADFIQVKFNNDAVFTNALFYDRCQFKEARVNAGFDFTSTVFYNNSPVFDNMEIADRSLFKPGSAVKRDFFDLPKNKEE